MASSPSPSSALSTPPQYRGVGVALAIGSGVLIGSSFVFKKKGLIASQSGPGAVAGEGVAYLKNAVWWIGMIMMIVGELCNAAAYAFTSAVIVTPLGALSVVICAVLSSIFLKERLSLFGWIGCFQCIVGSVIVALNAPEQQSVDNIKDFKRLFLAPGFLSFGSVIIVAALIIIFYFAPKYGKSSMLWYISVCSMIGGLSVSCTQGLGACIVTSIRGENQFKNWFIYFLLAFVAVTLVTEIYFLNMALALFNTAMVTPTYYVIFTGCTLVTTVVLYQGVKASVGAILTVVFAFLIICSGITLLQISKVEPSKLRHLDRRTTILLQAAREEVAAPENDDPEKALLQASEDPGLDTLRGGFGGLGTIVRARRRASTIGESDVHRSLSGVSTGRQRHDSGEAAKEWENVAGRGVRRFQLTDAPVTRPGSSSKSPTDEEKKHEFGNGNGAEGKKRRDSHDSSAAVRGSVAFVNDDHAETPRQARPPLQAAVDDEGPGSDLSMHTLLAQQNWAARPKSSAGELDAAMLMPPPQVHGTKHTMIHFTDDLNSTPPPTSTAAARRAKSEKKHIPPISQTPPTSTSLKSSSSSSTSVNMPTPGRLSPSPGASGRLSPNNMHLFSSPLSLSPAQTPEYEHAEPSPSSVTASSSSRPSRLRAHSASAQPNLPHTEEEEDEDLVAGSVTTSGYHADDNNETHRHTRVDSEISSEHESIPSTDRSGARGLLGRGKGSY